MSNYVKLASDASDSYFAGLTETQDNFVKSVAAFTAFMPAPPPPAVHGTGELPTVQEIMEASFSFAQRFLRQQQGFFEKVIAASTPQGGANAAARNAPAKTKSAPAS